MPDTKPQTPPATLVQVGGRHMIRVPWALADRYREFFLARGVGSTLHLDPASRDARLEPWADRSPARLRALLDGATAN